MFLILFYSWFDFYLQTSTNAMFCRGTHSLSPALRQRERLRKCHRNKLRTENTRIEQFSFQESDNGKQKVELFPSCAYASWFIAYSSHAIPQLLQHAIICLQRQTVVCRAAYLSLRGGARRSSQHMPKALHTAASNSAGVREEHKSRAAP